ncbi:hypothetical protein OB2597_18916 [Pseudooceanicola batsensis HTCC2597]|uniref:Thioesterase domain-containing protein n=1 Tax=Pseudooceanicola batsensis (strain ATCC BAA-863 / DSM 15984 / KCTC 12145 / HTCC2597) TaxID=252305 RepID=A3U093_PSEBH|nr:PaaI family thioesterase [Pseudooceanicola batsensis]EAQ02184.1 hypothetical protein OB2597_18916 [Pseudooceanicola batsensis HTCC2597]
MQNDHDTAFAAAYPFQSLLGFRKTLFEKGRARFELEIRDAHLNLVGIPHGGVYSSMLDSALGAAGCFGGGDRILPAVTLTLNTSFLGQPKGTRLIAEGRVVGGGRRIYFSEGDIRDDLGNLLVRASGTFRLLG